MGHAPATGVVPVGRHAHARRLRLDLDQAVLEVVDVELRAVVDEVPVAVVRATHAAKRRVLVHDIRGVGHSRSRRGRRGDRSPASG